MKKRILMRAVPAIAAMGLLLFACGQRHDEAEVEAPGEAVLGVERVSDGENQDMAEVGENQGQDGTGEAGDSDNENQGTVATNKKDSSENPVCVIKEWNSDEPGKKYYCEELGDEMDGYFSYSFAYQGKVYLFFDKFYPDDYFGSYDYMLGIMDIASKQYKEVPVESDLEKLCVDKNTDDSVEGYDEDIETAGPMDEESGHYYVNYYWDEDEFAGVSLIKQGVDAEGNVFALAKYGYICRKDSELYEEEKYELLKWTSDGELILPRQMLESDELEEALEECAEMGDDFWHGRYVEDGFLKDTTISSVAYVDSKRFAGVYEDRDKRRYVMGLFTEVQ